MCSANHFPVSPRPQPVFNQLAELATSATTAADAAKELHGRRHLQYSPPWAAAPSAAPRGRSAASGGLALASAGSQQRLAPLHSQETVSRHAGIPYGKLATSRGAGEDEKEEEEVEEEKEDEEEE